VDIEELANLELVWATDDFSDYQVCVLGLFATCQKKPRVIILKSEGIDYYFMQDMKDRFYIASKWHMDHYMNSIPSSIRKNIKVIEITGVDTRHHSYATFRNDNPNALVPLFVQAMGAVNMQES
jgi:hypothetical protein